MYRNIYSFKGVKLFSKFTSCVDDILELVKEYKKIRPDDKEARLCEYDVYDAANQRDNAIAVLSFVSALDVGSVMLIL